MATIANDDSLLGLALPAVLLVGVITLFLFGTGMLRPLDRHHVASPLTLAIPAAAFPHRPGGDYLQAGLAVSAPLETSPLDGPLTIMVHEVSAADYASCVADDGCAAPEPSHHGKGNVPATGVSYEDAVAYAVWLSARTGEAWRLPTVEEWDFAAGALAGDHGLEGLADPTDPSQKWLADYDRAASEKVPGSAVPLPLGAVGANENGIEDLGGNVWEWTQTCYSRVTLGQASLVKSTIQSCGLRIVEGRHRMPINVFVRDAVRGGCSVGDPPDNLGFRLVLDQPWYARLAAAARSLWH